MTSGNNKMFRLAAGMAVAALFSFLAGCGPSSSSSGSDIGGAGPTPTPTPAVANGSMKMMISDASTEDWATIGVKVLSISLVPQGGGAPALAYTAPNPAPTTNLVQLDQLAELLGNLTVPANTYTSATLEISANPQDILLTASASPEAGFAGTAGATVPSSQIRVQNATGSAGSLTTSVSVSFSAPLVVTANQSNALDIEFDLSHPAFLVDHVPAGGGASFWAVNFKPCLRHHPVGDLRAFVLREPYGTVTAVASSNASFTMTKDYPVYPPTSPETAIASTESLEILADSTNGTIFYDMDAKTRTVIHDFSAEAPTLEGKYVRVAARYQSDGSLVAVRVWASATFNKVWLSPEGHVLQVNTAAGQLVIQNEEGTPVPVTVNATTEFFFRTPASAVADATPIGTGTAFLANLVRGFKVHASPVDPSATPLVAQTVDIEVARYDGTISAATTTAFTYTRNFAIASDDYTQSLDFISSSSPNGTDSNGNAITGYKWWYFTFPTLEESGANAIPDFVTATNGSVNFGGSAGAMKAWGETFATWNDPANPNGWAAPWTVLEPTRVPLGSVATPWASGSNGGFFGMTVPNGANTVSVDVSTVSGSAPLVYQVDLTNGIITVSAVDVTTTSGLNAMIAGLTVGAPVKVFGIPQPDGTIKAYVVFYYTGSLPQPSSRIGTGHTAAGLGRSM
jgi:hypothetical protein